MLGGGLGPGQARTSRQAGCKDQVCAGYRCLSLLKRSPDERTLLLTYQARDTHALDTHDTHARRLKQQWCMRRKYRGRLAGWDQNGVHRFALMCALRLGSRSCLCADCRRS